MLKRWMVRVQMNNKRHYYGSFKNEVDAAKAYNEAAQRLFGDFAYLNKYQSDGTLLLAGKK